VEQRACGRTHKPTQNAEATNVGACRYPTAPRSPTTRARTQGSIMLHQNCVRADLSTDRYRHEKRCRPGRAHLYPTESARTIRFRKGPECSSLSFDRREPRDTGSCLTDDGLINFSYEFSPKPTSLVVTLSPFRHIRLCRRADSQAVTHSVCDPAKMRALASSQEEPQEGAASKRLDKKRYPFPDHLPQSSQSLCLKLWRSILVQRIDKQPLMWTHEQR
jgi:hypothetical protein